jgi:hypothetical protein
MDKDNLEAVAAFIYAEKHLPKYYDLEPETLKEELDISDKTVEKILVCHGIFHDHAIFEQDHIFEKAACVLNDREADFDHRQELSTPELCWAIHCIREIDDTSPFDEMVLTYITAIIHDEGFLDIPKEFNQEKSIQGITMRALFKLLLPPEVDKILAIPEVKEGQKEMHDRVNDYCNARKVKLGKELKKIKDQKSK